MRGLVSVLPPPGQEGTFLPGAPGAASERTRELLDDEVSRITEECYAHAAEVLREHRSQLDHLARALLEHETLDEADAYRAAGVRPLSTAADGPPVQLAEHGAHDGGTPRAQPNPPAPASPETR